MSDDLQSLRQRIDELDEQLQALITERARLAEEVARTKQAEGEEVFYRAEREAEVLRGVMQRNQGPLSNEEMARLFREIMSACLALERIMNIAFLGPEGTFTQAAALKHFGHSVQTLPLGTIGDVFREVESGNASYGVVPVENSTEGVINHTLDEFMSSSLSICGEVELRIHHHLLSKNPDIRNIHKVYSHRQSLAQCRKWLDMHLSQVQQIDVSSNAEAARLASTDPESAAIAGESAADIYALGYLAKNIEDHPENTTRFLVVGKRETPLSGNDKTSMLVYTRNRPGALYTMLAPFAKHNISMSRIESRPSHQGMWNYAFFIDIEGHIDSDNVRQAIDELEQTASMVKILGSYPRAVL
ncbi:prephenate dehydratase [Thiohalophilus sp.]|uniref:prephenate dehydratase n=1 Tax=Thiohalophilus sp. TaxID=3028392 RepID=UPI002ACEC549|nr:prephenate dehydratase [Thiohalophilus sp.]MDZ7662762.1 prephenate dehydratase [Thiohalophilus sp.]